MRNLTANRTTTSLLAAAAVLAAALGIAELRPPADPSADGPAGNTSTRVERTSAVCPQPLQGMLGSTSYTAFTPTGDAADAGTPTGGEAALTDVTGAAPGAGGPSGSPGGKPDAKPSGKPSGKASGKPSGKASGKPSKPASGPRATLTETGVPVTAKAADGESAPAVAAAADGRYAPGFTVQQTTTVRDSAGRGLSGLTCAAAGTGFWFAGASTAARRTDYVVLTNAETQPAVVDVVLYGPEGEVDTGTAGSLTVPPGSSVPVLLSTLTQAPVADLVVDVAARTGRVSAALHAAEGTKGSDWLPAAETPAGTTVLPGLPADVSAARLVVLANGDDDADLKVQLSGPNGWFTPAGHETLHVKAGMVAAVDLGPVTRGSAAALRLSPTDPRHAPPIVAGVRVVRGKGARTDAAWLAGSGPVGVRATVAENRSGGSTLYLTAPGAAATVNVTSSSGSSGGSPVTKEVKLPAGGTVALRAPAPSGGKGVFAVTVERVSGGPVVAARMLAAPTGGVPMFTVQPLADDRSTVLVPHAAQDPAILTGG